MPVRSLTDTDKMERGLLVLFLDLGLFIAPIPLEIFLPTPFIGWCQT